MCTCQGAYPLQGSCSHSYCWGASAYLRNARKIIYTYISKSSVCVDSASLAYQRVQKVDCTSPRPVLILGPLLDAVKDMLVKESPGKFCRCPLGKYANLTNLFLLRLHDSNIYISELDGSTDVEKTQRI